MSETFTKVRYGLVGILLLFCAAVSAQTISGNVKDANGEPVIGATIMEQGTQNGTVTDFDGNFTLKLQKGGNINVSYVGMKSQVIKTAGKSSVNVTLEDDNTTLNDLVVVGYGTMKKSDLTGSVSSVNTEQLNAKGAPSVMGNLQGATPGVNITQTSSRAGGGFNIEIRGKSSLGDNNSPLFVVDGVICDDIDWLNPQDIEKIDILKDASSTAIYGSRATNGVVIVSTKSAKTQGGRVSKPTISYDGYIGFTSIARKPKWMSGSDFMKYRFLDFMTQNQTGTGQTEVYMKQNLYDEAMMTYTLDGESRSWILDRIAAGDTDWTDLVTRNAIQTNHYLAVSGNSNNTNYHFGVGYQKEDGVYKGDGMYRYNLKGTVDTKISEVLSAGISLNGAYRKSKTVNDDAINNAIQSENPLINPYNENGEIVPYPGQKPSLSEADQYMIKYGIPADCAAQFNSNVNPLLDFENSYYEQKNYQFLANAYLEARPMKGMTLKTTFSPNYISNRAGEYDGTNTNGHKLVQDNSVSVVNTSKFSWTWDNQINYNTRINDIHSINAMYLFSTSKFQQEKYTQTVRGVIDEELWYNMVQRTGDVEQSLSDYQAWSMTSHALRLNYSYKDKYLFTGTVRWDGSSRFAEGSRWGSFPSLALAWRVTEEPWMKKAEWLSNLKLRISYGVTGNNYVGSNYPTMVVVNKETSHYYGFADGTGNSYSSPSGIVNKNLTWEKTHEWNFGIDFGFLNNRITGSIDWYTKKSKDLLMKRQLIYELGGVRLYDNIGIVKNSGVEISLNTVNIKTKDWNWTTSFNFAHNKNKIVEVNGGTNDDITNGWFIGESINAIYNYNYLGVVSDRQISLSDAQYALYQNKGGQLDRGSILSRDYYYQVYGLTEGSPIIEDLNLDGEIDAVNDKKILGHADPSWTGSITSNLSYKNWDFSFSIYTRQGTTMYSPFYARFINYPDRGNGHVNFDYYIPAGTLLSCDGVNADGTYINPVYQEATHYGDFPFFADKDYMGKSAQNAYWETKDKTYSGTEDNPNDKGQPFQIVKGNYWKVSNISLGYTFPKQWLQKWGCQHLRLYVNVTNPFIWSTDNYLGFNPEWADAPLKNGGYSTVTWQIGASVKF